MNYFRKTKFRESSLIIVALFIAIVYFTTNTISVEKDKAVQEIMDARVEEAVEEALKEVTTTTFPMTTTTTLYQNGIVIGYVRDVQLNDKGEVYGILINYRYWVSFDSSVELYAFNTKIDEWDFKQGDHVVAVLAGEKFDSLPAQSVASAIHIIYEPEEILLPDVEPLSQTESYAQNNTLDQLVSTEIWYLFDADPPKSKYPEDLRRIEVLQTKLSEIYPEVQITSIYDEQTYQYHEKYCAEYNITECSLPYISDEHSYVTTTTLP